MTGPHRQQAGGPEPDRQEERRRQAAALRELAAERAGALRTGGDWEGWLRLAARLPGQSFTNVLLIAAQRRAATQVASYEQSRAPGPAKSSWRPTRGSRRPPPRSPPTWQRPSRSRYGGGLRWPFPA